MTVLINEVFPSLKDAMLCCRLTCEDEGQEEALITHEDSAAS